MPELPEVETVRRGAEPLLVGRRLDAVELRRCDLRWPIPARRVRDLVGRRCRSVERRSKYLLLGFDGAAAPVAIVHLGMSGRLLVDVTRGGRAAPPWRAHEHWRMVFRGRLVRFVDPRRFGCLLAAERDGLAAHPLLCRLGREPLQPGFDGAFLHAISRGRRVTIKHLLMDGSLVVGVGNVYASEACWRACVRPRRAAGSLRRTESDALARGVREVLEAAIAAGGTSFRDYVGVREDAGFFARELAVYGRDGQPCRRCGIGIRRTVDGGRSSYWCPGCQR